MEKINKAAFLLLFFLGICLAGKDNLEQETGETPQIPTIHNFKRNVDRSKKSQWQRKTKRLRKESEGDYQDINELIDGTQYMCVCPNAHEFLAALKSFSSSDTSVVDENISSEYFLTSDILDEAKISPSSVCSSPDALKSSSVSLPEITPSSNVWIKCEISPDDETDLQHVLYSYPFEKWKESVEASPSLETSEVSIREKIPSPIIFFRNTEQKILCLAWCGKGFEAAAAFYENSKIFKNLKHIFICGICACPSREIEIGSVFYSKSYVKLPCSTIGDAQSPRSKKKNIYLKCRSCYFTDPQIHTDDSGFSASFQPYMEGLGIPVNGATNFSFDSFVEDRDLAESIITKVTPELPIIDMEGSNLALAFSNRGCTVFSLRIVSDHAGASDKSIQLGKPIALKKLAEILKLAVHFWMTFFSKQDLENYLESESGAFLEDSLVVSPTNSFI